MRNRNDRGPRDAPSWDGTVRRKVSNDGLQDFDQREQDIDVTDAVDVLGFGPFREKVVGRPYHNRNWPSHEPFNVEVFEAYVVRGWKRSIRIAVDDTGSSRRSRLTRTEERVRDLERVGQVRSLLHMSVEGCGEEENKVGGTGGTDCLSFSKVIRKQFPCPNLRRKILLDATCNLSLLVLYDKQMHESTTIIFFMAKWTVDGRCKIARCMVDTAVQNFWPSNERSCKHGRV